MSRLGAIAIAAGLLATAVAPVSARESDMLVVVAASAALVTPVPVVKTTAQKASEQQAAAKKAADVKKIEDAKKVDDEAKLRTLPAYIAGEDRPPADGGSIDKDANLDLTDRNRQPDDFVKDSSIGKADTWLSQLASPAAILASVAIILALMGLTLWWMQTGELRAVQSALRETTLPVPPEQPKSSGRDTELQALFVRLVFAMEKMQERIDDLERQIKTLQTAGARGGSEKSPVSLERSNPNAWFGQKEDRHAVDYSRQEEMIRRQPEPLPPPPQSPRLNFNSDAAAVVALSRDPQFQQVLHDYNRTAQSGDKTLITEFIRRYGPQEVSSAGEGALINGADDLLWFVSFPNSDYGVVLPGASPIREWHKSYRTMMGQQARERFGTLYEVLDGPDMLIVDPAWVRSDGSRYHIVKPGVLSGVLKGA
jgi:hypothetical protein